MGKNPGLARKISTIAARQHGHITRAQLLALGVPSKTGEEWVRRRVLIPVHAGVYALEYVRTEPVARAAAAVLACGPGALLSHHSAAALWGLRAWPRRLEVTVPGDRRRPGIAVHRSRTLVRADIRHHMGIRITSPARTVFDIARGLDDAALARAVNDARLKCGCKPGQLRDLVRRLPCHAGAARIGALIETPGAPTRSVFEDAFLDFCRRAGLPRPQVNVMVAGHEVDALFAAERVIVELDSYGFHQGKRSFESDRARDADTLAAGFVTIRITWERLTGGGRREAERLRAILKERR